MQTLEEENEADETLTEIAATVNLSACECGEEDEAEADKTVATKRK